MDFLLAALYGALALSPPVLLAAIGGVLGERAGLVTLGLEAYLLAGAFGAACGTAASGSPAAGALAGVLSAAFVAALLAACVLEASVDPVLAGILGNVLLLPATTLGAAIVFGGSSSPPLETLPSFSLSIPGVPHPIRLSSIALFALGIPLATSGFLFRTQAGLRWIAAGEDPIRLRSLGGSPRRQRWMAALASGALGGLGGAYLSIGVLDLFQKDMVQGRGYVAVAAVILGRWRPIPAALAALAFGAVEGLAQAAQSWVDVPSAWLRTAPYIGALAAILVARAPAAPPGLGGRA